MKHQEVLTLDQAHEIIKNLSIETQEAKRLEIEFTNDKFMLNGLPVLKRGLSNLGNIIGLPIGFIQQYCQDDKELSNQIIKKCKSRDPEQKLIIWQDGKVIKNVVRDVPTIAPKYLLDIVSGFNLESLKIGELTLNGSLHIKFITDETASPPTRVNDISHVGFGINIQPQLEIYPYTQRLICSNGMTIDEIIRINKVEKPENIIIWLRNEINQAIKDSRQVLSRFVSLSETKVDDPQKTLLRLCQERHLLKSQYEELWKRVNALDNKNDLTYYDLVNLVSEYGRDLLRAGFITGNKIQRFAGYVIKTGHEQRCSVCNHLL